MPYMIRKRVLAVDEYCWLNFEFLYSIGYKTCSCGFFVDMECLEAFKSCFGMILVKFECEQGRTSTSFAQASHSCLSENCRNPFLVLGRASRSGNQFLCWTTRSLAQARMARPCEVAMRHIACYIESLSRRGAVCLSERGSCSGEKVSPKRDIVVSHYFTLAQAKRSNLSETNTLA